MDIIVVLVGMNYTLKEATSYEFAIMFVKVFVLVLISYYAIILEYNI